MLSEGVEFWHIATERTIIGRTHHHCFVSKGGSAGEDIALQVVHGSSLKVFDVSVVKRPAWTEAQYSTWLAIEVRDTSRLKPFWTSRRLGVAVEYVECWTWFIYICLSDPITLPVRQRFWFLCLFQGRIRVWGQSITTHYFHNVHLIFGVHKIYLLSSFLRISGLIYRRPELRE